MLNNKIVREKNDPHEVVHELIFAVSMILYGISVSGFNVFFLVLCRFNSGNRCSTEGHTHRLKLVSLLCGRSSNKCTNTMINCIEVFLYSDTEYIYESEMLIRHVLHDDVLFDFPCLSMCILSLNHLLCSIYLSLFFSVACTQLFLVD